jgi:hypothetical protein
VLPAVTPVTTPEAFTVATAVFDEVQTPLAVALASAVVEPAHTSVVPVIAGTTGNWFTLTVVTALVAVHPLLSVIVTLYDVVAVGVTVIAAVVAPVLHT